MSATPRTVALAVLLAALAAAASVTAHADETAIADLSQGTNMTVALDRATHSIRHPREITVEESPAGLVSVAVIDEDGAQQVVRLKDPLKLPSGSPGPG